jgi:hypothetical protein
MRNADDATQMESPEGRQRYADAVTKASTPIWSRRRPLTDLAAPHRG